MVIPVYNSEAYLKKCLDSMQVSSFTNLEILCVDDGSTDRSMEILRSYARADPRIRIFTQDHQYAGAARNTGIKAASGKYIHFLDSDDEIFRMPMKSSGRLRKVAGQTYASACMWRSMLPPLKSGPAPAFPSRAAAFLCLFSQAE